MPYQTVKRIESDRSWGASNDATVWPVGSFQYSEHIDVRNNLGGIQLQSSTDDALTTALIGCYCNTPSHFYKFLQNGKVIITTAWSIWWSELTLTGLIWWDFIQDAVLFDNTIYAVGVVWSVYTIALGWSVAVPVTFPANSIPSLPAGRASLLEFWNAQLVVAVGNLLFTKTRGFNEWTLCRQYDTGCVIECMSMVGNSIVVYVWYPGGSQVTKAFFLTGTFSQDDTGVAQGIIWSWSVVRNMVNVKWNPIVFGITNSWSSNSAVNTMHIGTWYDSILIKESLNSEWVSYMQDEFQLELWGTPFLRYGVANDSVYIPARDWLRVYSMNKLGTGMLLCKEYAHTYNTAGTSCVSNEYAFASYTNGGQSFERRYKLGNNKQPYTTSTGSLISRVYNGWSWYKHKKKMIVWLDVAYDLTKTTEGQIRIYVRPDRASYNQNLWRALVGTITDTTQSRYVQSPWVETNDALWLDFFQLEYKIEIDRWSSPTWTPIVSEISFTLWVTENAKK